MQIMCRHLDWQVSSAVQILTAFEPILSIVGDLMLYHMEADKESSEWHNEVDRTQWRDLLRPFKNVKIFRVQSEFAEELGRSLHSKDEEMPLDILSNLKELRYSGGRKSAGAFRPFIQQRNVAGHPVNLRSAGSSEFQRYKPS
jgi:hypothetical protein